ncbi:MAG TPA: AmmeMemoRadiSam system protein B [Gammaproteobacteria bacterium]
MPTTREPAVAGLFYPGEPSQLQHTVADLLGARAPTLPPPKALIVPHAGYVYSGATAAAGYALLAPVRERISRVVLLGPAHRVAFRGIAMSSAADFRTPLGAVPLDTAALASLRGLPHVGWLDQAHAQEHSLEVHLPFLQLALDAFSLVPLVVGEADAPTVGAVLERLWGGDETLIVISSDLSHYHDYATAQALDAATSAAIEQLAPERIDHGGACGRYPIGGLLWVARRKGLKCTTLELCNSGDTAGTKDRVVGYGAYAFH